jgi:hypothetical protein
MEMVSASQLYACNSSERDEVLRWCVRRSGNRDARLWNKADKFTRRYAPAASGISGIRFATIEESATSTMIAKASEPSSANNPTNVIAISAATRIVFDGQRLYLKLWTLHLVDR